MRIGPAYILFFFATVLMAQEASPSAARLVKVMAADQSALFGLQRGFEKLRDIGKLTDKQFECTKRLDETRLLKPLAALIAGSLTESEIASATAFFESPTGGRVLLYAEARRYESAGIRSPVGKVALSAREIARLQQFVATPSGKKLITDSLLTGSAQSQSLLLKEIDNVFIECAGKSVLPANQ